MAEVEFFEQYILKRALLRQCDAARERFGYRKCRGGI